MPPRQQASQPAPPPQQQPVGATTAVAGAVAGAQLGKVPAAAAKAAVDAVVQALEAAFVVRLRGIPPEVLGLVRKQYPAVTDDESRRIAQLEIAREREFQRRVLGRVRKDIADALRIDDPAERQKRLAEILDREARYGRMREEALHARVVARAEQGILKTVSPKGAFWRLSDLTAGNHTADCVAMANKWWPWSVLDLLHPPLHPNCPCTLHGFGEAVARGWMSGDAPPDSGGAVARARRIMRAHPEHRIARRHLREGRFREELHPRSRVGRFIDKLGMPSYRVGGAVRDRLLGRAPKDEDYVVVGTPESVRARVQALGGRADDLKVRDRVVGLRAYHEDFPPGGVEIAPPRIEKSTGAGRHDFEIVPHPGVYGDNASDPGAIAAMLVSDAHRRDFTVNALYEDSAGRIVDPTGRGRADLAARVLRTTSHDSFAEDPLRILRALRFVSQLGFDLAPETEEQMREHAPQMTALTQRGVSGTAVTELNKMLMGEHVGKALRIARDTGALQSFLPELAPMVGFDQRSQYHDLPLDEHTFSVVENAAAAGAPLEVRLAALFHDAGKPEVAFEGKDGNLHFYQSPENGNVSHEAAGAAIARAALTRLNYPAALRERVVRLVAGHMVPHASSKRPSAARRFRAEMGADLTDSLLALRRADVSAKGEADAETVAQVEAFAQRVAEEGDSPTAVRDLAITGEDLKGIGIAPGPGMGQILNQLLHEVVAEPRLNNREWLLKRAEGLRGTRNFGVLADAVGVPEARPLGITGRMTRALGKRLDGFSYNGLTARHRAIGGPERLFVRFYAQGDPDDVGYGQFSLAGDHLHMDRLFLNEEHRGRGFGSAFTLELFDALRERDIHRVTLEAVDVGGYAWARAGFLFDLNSSGRSVWQDQTKLGKVDSIERIWGRPVRDDMERFVMEGRGRSRSEFEIAMWGREHAIDDPHYGKLWPGKALMLGSQWSGALDLGNLREAAATAVSQTWEDWMRAGKLHVPPDDIAGDDDLAFWAEVERAGEIREAVNWRELLHPRNRVGKFVDKPKLHPGLATAPAHMEEEAERLDALDRLEAALARADDTDGPALEGYRMKPLAGALGAAGFELADAFGEATQTTKWIHGATGSMLAVISRDQRVVAVQWEAGRPQTPRKAERPIEGWADLRDDALALSNELVDQFQARQRLRGFGINERLGDTAGMHEWNGDAWIGPDAQDTAEVVGRLRREGKDVPEDVLGPMFFAEQVAAHEISHSVNSISFEGYVHSNIGRALEEALTEEASQVIVVRRLRERGETDVLEWLRGNQARPYGQGTYHAERQALQFVLDQANVAPEDRENLILALKFVVPPDERLDYLGNMLVDAGKSEAAALNVLRRLNVESDFGHPSRLGPFNVAPDLEGIRSRTQPIGFGRSVYMPGQELTVSVSPGRGEPKLQTRARVLDGTESALVVQTPVGLARIDSEDDIIEAAHEPGTLELEGDTARIGEEIEYLRPDGKPVRGRLVWVHRRSGDFLAEVRVGDRTVVITPGSTKGVRKIGTTTTMAAK